MNPALRLRSTLIHRFFRAALLALPLATLTLAGCGSSGNTGSGGGGTGGGGGADSTCSKDKPCAKGSCVFGPGTCGANAEGQCLEIIQCDGPPSGATCGCDGKTVEGEYPGCAAGPHDNAAACQTGTFACGAMLSCKRNLEICVEKIPGVPGPSTFECIALEKANQWCVDGIPSCNCLDPEKVGPGATCAEDADHQETIKVAMP